MFLWVIFALLDPGPQTWLYPDPIRIRKTDLFLVFWIRRIRKFLDLPEPPSLFVRIRILPSIKQKQEEKP